MRVERNRRAIAAVGWLCQGTVRSSHEHAVHVVHRSRGVCPAPLPPIVKTVVLVAIGLMMLAFLYTSVGGRIALP
jgi:hypothetical protein